MIGQSQKSRFTSAQLHRGGHDERGRRLADSAPVELPRVMPWDRESTEPTQGHGPTQSRAAALILWPDIPAGVQIEDRDRLLIAPGRLEGWWDIDGKPREWRRGVEIQLIRGHQTHR